MGGGIRWRRAGDTDTARRLTTAVLAGCVPVVICDWCKLPFEAYLPYDDFVVQVPTSALLSGALDLIAYLEAIPAARVRAMQATLLRVRHHFLPTAGAPQPGDLLDMVVQEMRDAGMFLRHYRRWARLRWADSFAFNLVIDRYSGNLSYASVNGTIPTL